MKKKRKQYSPREKDTGQPIRVGEKFRENHKNQDVSMEDVKRIRNKVFLHSKPAPKNRKKMARFHKKKNPQDKT